MKRIISIILMTVMLLSQYSFAEESVFTDVDLDHWAYDAIKEMSDRGIIKGYDDNTFKPDAPITRGEFAKVMVLALGLEPSFNVKSSFVDMEDSHWVVPYAQAAKSYLTGYSSSSGTKFKPDENAVREDMAVAIIRARGIDVSEADESYLNDYVDSGQIDSAIRRYVGAAIKHEVMIGSIENGSKVFKPSDVLTRAEAAVLLLKIVDEGDVKIVLDGSDILLTSEITDEGLVLSWQVIEDDNLEGFKVVVSKYDDEAIYPDSGYVKYISNADQREILLKGKMTNNNGDTDYVMPGEAYYFSITALYKDEKIASNSILITYPSTDCDTTDVILEGQMVNGVALLEWTSEACDDISGYKVVASKSDGSPIYPENGYYKYLSGSYHKNIEISEGSYYNNGDFSQFKAGETYYFSITALVGNEKIPSNTIALKFGEHQDAVVELTGVENGNQIVLEWTDSNDKNITGFKVVASKEDGSPIYPGDGYYKYIAKGQNQRVEINVNDYYNNGDFDKFQAGEDYYFSITALDGDKKVASNTIKLGFDSQALVTPPVVTLEGRVDGDKVILEWVSFNDHNVEGFKIVASKFDGTPKYPDNGYYKYVSPGSEERIVIEVGSYYNNGDFDKFLKGESYYFSITTIYSGGKEASNTIQVKFND